MSATGSEENGVTAPAAFIVRAWRDRAGRVSGVVERVTTGEKARFEDIEALAEIIRRMLARPRQAPPGGDA
jgi:hypothetical protein